MTKVVIPDSVTTIGSSAFRQCLGLAKVTIGKSVSTIGEAVFLYTGLSSIVVNSENPVYDSRNNCNAIIETATNKLIVGSQNTIIPNSVTCIKSYAFGGNSKLTSIEIPSSVTEIGLHVFIYCDLTSITVDKDNPVYDSRENCNAIIETSTNTLLVGCKNTVIPNSVTSIGYSAFEGCTGLTEIEIPQFVTTIDSSAFYNCFRLTEVRVLNTTPPTCGVYCFEEVDTENCVLKVPVGSKELYETAEVWKEFTNIIEMKPEVVDPENICINGIYYRILSEDELTAEVKFKGNSYNEYTNEYSGDIVIPETIIVNNKTYTVTSIGENAFSYCDSLTNITMPNTIICIGSGAFSRCHNLRSIAFPHSLKAIGSSAFFQCTSLTGIKIPASVTCIGESSLFGKTNPFSSCNNLTSIIVASENATYSSSGNCNAIIETATGTLISGCQNTIIPSFVKVIGNRAFYWQSYLESISIPNSITAIGSEAFEGCIRLESITIPKQVESIGDRAFFTTGLISVKVHKTLPITLPNETFSHYVNDLASATLYVPEGCKELYETAEVWKEFGQIIEDGSLGAMENINIDTTATGDAEYYNLNGVKVAEDNLPTGFYIKRQNGRSTKIFVK